MSQQDPSDPPAPPASLGRILSQLSLKVFEPGTLISAADVDHLRLKYEAEARDRALRQIEAECRGIDALVAQIRDAKKAYQKTHSSLAKQIKGIEKRIDLIAAGKDPDVD